MTKSTGTSDITIGPMTLNKELSPWRGLKQTENFKLQEFKQTNKQQHNKHKPKQSSYHSCPAPVSLCSGRPWLSCAGISPKSTRPSGNLSPLKPPSQEEQKALFLLWLPQWKATWLICNIIHWLTVNLTGWDGTGGWHIWPRIKDKNLDLLLPSCLWPQQS